jgi:prepilin signal peptidase PulO-like enzyme (type II secretory pathway)
VILLIITVLGLCFGSFVNALVWRLYQQGLPKKKRAASDAELSIATGRSMCRHCRHTLAWYDLLPVLSWLSLGGKCRYCKTKISWQYPLVELLTAGLFVVSYIFWPKDISIIAIQQLLFMLWLVALVMFMALIVYDLRWMLLPNKIIFPLIGVGSISAFLQVVASSVPLRTAFLSLGGLAVAGGLFYVLFQISGGKWIGGGDVKLGFAIGLLLGSPILAFLMLFVASLLGLLVAVPGIVLRKSTFSTKIPFGPFLILATIIVMLFGQHIVDWYGTTLLYL